MLSGALFIALGLAIMLLPPRRLLKSFFGIYAIGLGILVLMINVPHLLAPGAGSRAPDVTLGPQARLFAAGAGAVAAFGLAGIGWRILATRAGAAAMAWALAVFVLLVSAGLLLQATVSPTTFPGLTSLGAFTVTAGSRVLVHAAGAAAFLAAAFAAWQAARDAPREVPRTAFLALGIGPLVAFPSGDSLAYAITGDARAAIFPAFVVAALAGASLLWVRVAARAEPRWPMFVAVSTMLLVVAGAGVYFLDPSGNTGAAGLVRTASVIVLGYGTLRHDLFGLGSRLQQGLRGSTVALAFGAAFLVGGRIGEAFLQPPLDLLVGTASMVAVLVVLAPLLRAADRLAASAAEATRTPTVAVAPAPGATILGRYRVEEHLGEGGNGAAYLCHDTVLGRPVVAKALPLRPGLVRHLEEARSLAKLRHPHVVQVFDVSEDGQFGYILMEHVAGGSLAARLRQGPLPTVELARIADGLLSALAECHRSGIVHGDMKPENVLIEKEGVAKLADFGSARAVGASKTARHGGLDGTLLYMSPEQVRGEPPTAASDIYATGVLLASAASGRHPFARPGMDDFLLRQAILTAPPTLDGVPGRLGVVLARALEKDPAARYTDAASLRDDVRTALLAETGNDA